MSTVHGEEAGLRLGPTPLRGTRGRLDVLERRVLALESRVASQGQALHTLEARLEALDQSFVRHQGQNETDLDDLRQRIDRLGLELDRHQDAHWRGR